MSRVDHQQRAAIRRNAADDIANGMSIEACAAKYGHTAAWVRALAKECGVSAASRSRVIVEKRKCQLREFASLGSTQAAFHRLTGITRTTVCLWARSMGLRFRKDALGYAKVIAASKSKASVMAALYQDGYTLEQIGAQYGITRERVRQLIKKHHKLTGSDGGQHVRAERIKARRMASKDAEYMASHGCTYAQWQEVRVCGNQMLASGKGIYRTPLRAFSNQRNNAKNRGIGWELTFWQWWTIWQQSGRWEERGRGQGYVMCRNGDDGPYAVGNVYIATAAHNSSEGQNPKKIDPSLPIGVSRTATGKYTAMRRIDGRARHLGTYATPELAYAAYLMASAPGFEPPASRSRAGWARSGTKGYIQRGSRYYAYVYQGTKQVYLGSFATPDAARAAHLAAKAERLAA